MNILISAIDSNPHRDLVRNPVSEEQITKLVESINRTGFWDNLVIRPHPEVANRYQLAYGHNRLAACVRAGITEVDLPVRELADYDMLCCMIDENNTQQSITPKIIFENVTAALMLAEKLLLSTENVNDFNKFVKTPRLPDMEAVNFWRNNEYEKAKSAISESGDGLGVFFIKQFMPSPPHNDTLQSVIDSYYADRRKAAAEKRKAVELEAARIADEERQRLEAEAQEKHEAELQAQRESDQAARLQREAKEAAEKAVREQNESARLKALEVEKEQRKAKSVADAAVKKAKQAKDSATHAAVKKAKQVSDHTANANRESVKSERMDFAGVDRELLETLDSTAKMNDVVRFIKKNKIPKEFHAELIKEAENWTVDGSCADQVRPNSVSIKGFEWWDEKSGNRAKRFDAIGLKAKEEAMRKKFGEYPFDKTVFKFVENLNTGNTGPLSDLVRCSEHFDALNQERLTRLHKVLLGIKKNHNEVMDGLLGKIVDLITPAEKDITPCIELLDYQQEGIK